MESQSTNENDQSDPSTLALSSNLRHRREISSSKEPTVNKDESATETRNTIDSDTPLTNSWSLIMFIYHFMIKPIWVLLKLITRSITLLPLSMLGYCIMFVIDPFRTMRQVMIYVVTKLIKLWTNLICGTLITILGWGMCRIVYVGFVLCCLLFASFVISGSLMNYLVEEPLVIKKSLNFYYTKDSPVAFVPIVSCEGVGKKNFGSRVIPPDRGMQVTVSLTLPESDYNRNLGMFQVRTDYLSVNGETLASSSHPCMMRFKSLPIRLVHTLFKFAPLVTGYVSEVETLNVKMRGLNQGNVPTSCLRVILEQRASYRPGDDIPELYGASLILESELPFIKRIIWYWKRTVFVLVSVASFATELLFVSVCCRCVLVPRTRKTNGCVSRSAM